MRLRPVPASGQPPAIDNIADEKQMFGFSMFQKFEQKLSLATFGAKMDIGYPYRSITQRTLGLYKHQLSPGTYSRVVYTGESRVG
jgi:hypothetical protein